MNSPTRQNARSSSLPGNCGNLPSRGGVHTFTTQRTKKSTKKVDDSIQLIILGQEEAEALTDEQAAWDKEMDVMWNRNMIAGALHSFNFVVGFYLSQTVESMQEFTIGLSTVFLDWDDVTQTATQQLKTQYEFPFVAWTTMFALMSALAHGATLLWWDKYTADLALGLNRFRWWEYAISSSLMICLICMLFGVYDIFSLIFIAAINCAMNLFGDIHELMNAGKQPENVDWTAFWYGSLAGVFPWFVIFMFMVSSPGVNNAPWFVWAILVTYLVLFTTFPWTMWHQYNQNGKYNNENYPLLKNGGYLAGERQYQFLSYVAKTMLIWLVISGSNQPSEYTEGA